MPKSRKSVVEPRCKITLDHRHLEIRNIVNIKCFIKLNV